MNLESIKEQLKEALQNLSNEIQENAFYQTQVEKFASLSSRVQKLIAVCACSLLALVLISIPYSYFSSSKENIKLYEQEKEIIDQLLDVARKQPSSSFMSHKMSSYQLKSKVEQIVGRLQLLPDQIGNISAIASVRRSLARPPIKEEAVRVTLKTLNLEQIIKVGHELQTIAPLVKVTGLNIEPNADEQGYFNAEFKVSTFFVPIEEEKTRPKRKFKRRGRGS